MKLADCCLKGCEFITGHRLQFFRVEDERVRLDRAAIGPCVLIDHTVAVLLRRHLAHQPFAGVDLQPCLLDSFCRRFIGNVGQFLGPRDRTLALSLLVLVPEYFVFT